MAESIAYAEVWLWNNYVGAVAEEEDGKITFEFFPGFLKLGLEISPLRLPLSTAGPVTFPELHRLEAFEGLPGVLADSLPDRFGNAVIKKYFSDRGRPYAAMSPVQKLLYIGKRAMGALEFRPPIEARSRREREPLEIAELVEQARIVIEGRPEISIPEMMRIGASAGGARAKALILWNKSTGKIRSGFARPETGDEHWMIKFDGVGELGHPDSTPKPYNRIEYVYSQLAQEAGIEIPETTLLEENKNGHLLVKRFDRDGTSRKHLHSLGGMHHVDFNEPGLFSYEQFLRTILTLNMDYPVLEEAFRRSVFNIVAVNQDDHVKNFSFLMTEDGRWSLSPAYDLTYSRGAGYTRHHQMSLNGKRDDYSKTDLLALGGKMGINRDGKDILEEVVEVMSRWPRYASDVDIPYDKIDLIGHSHRLF